MKPELTPLSTGLKGLVAAIEQHNKNHSASARTGEFLGMILGSMFGGKEDKNMPVQPLPDPDKGAEEIFSRYGNVLFQLGLEFSQNQVRSLKKELDFASGEKPFSGNQSSSLQRSSDHIDLLLNDADKFCLFLKSLSPRDCDNHAFQSALNFVATAFDAQLVNSYVTASHGIEADQHEKLLNSLEPVMSELRRIGATQAAGILENHLERAWQGDLKEFLLAESNGMLFKTAFGPDGWHKDMNIDSYQSRWDKVIDIVEFIKENPKARQLFDSIHTRLSEQLDTAEIDIRKILSTSAAESAYWRERGEPFLEILEESRRRLNIIGL